MEADLAEETEILMQLRDKRNVTVARAQWEWRRKEIESVGGSLSAMIWS